MRTKWNIKSSGLAVPIASATILLLALPCQAQQTSSRNLGQLQAGYGGSRYTTATSAAGSTRDANGNRLIVDGIIQSGASSYQQSSGGVSAGSHISQGGRDGTAIGGATAIGNNLNVVVQGNHNTVIVRSNQTNTGNITAGTVLNGRLVFQ